MHNYYTIYNILYYTTLYYTILYYTILYYTILYYTIRPCGSRSTLGHAKVSHSCHILPFQPIL